MAGPASVGAGGAGAARTARAWLVARAEARRRLWIEALAPRRLFQMAMAATVLMGVAFAFVGLSASSYFVDELFTLHLIDHQGGLPEVVRRTLADTGPPLYYGLLYLWSKLAGLSEAALRLPSALFAVAAALMVAGFAPEVLGRSSRLFALAVALCGRFWLVQSQLARCYGLGLGISAGYILLALAIRRQALAGQKPVWPWAGLTLLGLAGCMTHFYLGLEAGLVAGYLILTTGRLRLKAALAGSGLAFVAATAAYVAVLLGRTQEDIHHTWFGAGPGFLARQVLGAVRDVYGPPIALVMAALILTLALRFRRARREGAAVRSIIPPPLAWTAGLAIFVLAGMTALGIVVCLAVAPSLSARNLLIAAPMLWLLTAAVFQLGGPRWNRAPGPALGLAIAIALAFSQAQNLEGRLLPRGEEWRDSARYVDSLKACRGQTIPVLASPSFGPPTAYVMGLAELAFYGHYDTQPGRLSAFTAHDLNPARRADLAQLMRGRVLGGSGDCPVLAWQVHDLTPSGAEALRGAIAEAAGVPLARVTTLAFRNYELKLSGWRAEPEAWVFLAQRPGPARAQASSDSRQKVI